MKRTLSEMRDEATDATLHYSACRECACPCDVLTLCAMVEYLAAWVAQESGDADEAIRMALDAGAKKGGPDAAR